MIITGIQMRMGRAALNLTTKEFGTLLGISGMAVSRYERGDEGVISVATVRRVTEFFKERQVYFGPMNAVCAGIDLFACANCCRGGHE